MDKENFIEILMNRLKEINIAINKEKAENFYEFTNLLLEWNEKINLTAITDIDDIILKHYIDSLTINKYITSESKVIDIGTGAGFPGIPLKIINNNEIILVDSLNKRIKFLEEVKERLKIDNLELIHSRVEELARNKKYREMCDIAVSRAVANLATLAEYMLPFVKENGICICMKGPNVENEIEISKKAIKILGGKIEKVENINLPNTDIERNLIIIKKIGKTPSAYPRKAGMPTKQPLL